MVYISNITTLKSICNAYFHFNITHEIIFWGNSSNSGEDLHFTEENCHIIAGAQPRTSCTSLFKQLENLPFPCQYVLSLTDFTINNQENFHTHSTIHNINTRNKHHLHRPNANLSCFQKGTFYVGIKIVDI
jgi:hypothetical protein